MSEPDAPPQAPSPEDTLEPVREQSHEEPGLAERVKALEARELELVALAQRVQADFENHRRRTRDEAAAAAAKGKETLLRALLPVLDNLDRALAHTQDAGLKLVARQLSDALAQQGVRVLEPLDEPFDARLHEAIAKEERDGAKSGTILAVAEKGYALDGRVLRPARVVVAA